MLCLNMISIPCVYVCFVLLDKYNSYFLKSFTNTQQFPRSHTRARSQRSRENADRDLISSVCRCVFKFFFSLRGLLCEFFLSGFIPVFPRRSQTFNSNSALRFGIFSVLFFPEKLPFLFVCLVLTRQVFS